MKEHFYLWNILIKILSTPIITIFSGFSKIMNVHLLRGVITITNLQLQKLYLLLVEAEFYLSL